MYKIIDKYWGVENWIMVTPDYAFKRLNIDKDKTLLNHYHEIKEETFYITEGTGVATIDGKDQYIQPGDIIHIIPKTRHQIKAITDLVIFEASTSYLKDSIREVL